MGRTSRGEAARQCGRALSRLEDHPDLGEPAPDEIAALLRAASASGDEHLVWRARRFDAQLTGARGDLAAAVEQLLQVQHYAASHRHARLLAQAHHDLSWCYRDIGDLDSFLHHAAQSVEQLDADAPAAVRAMHLLRLADALDECGSAHEAVERYAEAEAYAAQQGETVRQVTCLNNRAYAEYCMGDVQAAQTTMERLFAVCAEHDLPLHWSQLDTVARIEVALGLHDRAVDTSRRALQMYEDSGTTEVLAPLELLLTRALAERSRGCHDVAQECLDRARQQATEARAASLLVSLEREQAELHAACGDWQAAYRGLQAFHAAEKALLSEQRAARTTLRLAVLRTQEARAEAEHFRSESLRDALTGLSNRRFVDQDLPRLLDLRRQGRAVAVALVDLDHFKLVNDTCSHVAGDAVLVTVAHQLEDALATWRRAADGDGLVARLGGEEFLVVLTGGSAPEVVQHIERLRERVSQHDWRPVTGTVPVRISVGLSWAGPQDTQHCLLRRVDALLYEAKRAGRDRIVHDGAAAEAPAAARLD